MMNRFHATAFISVFIILFLSALNWSTAAANSDSHNGPSITHMPVEYEAEFRRSLGFRSDEAHIKAVRASDDSITVANLGGVVLTQEEFRELQIRLDIEKDVDTLIEIFTNKPALRNALGGIYIEHFAGAEDHTKGGKLVLQLVEGHIQPEAILQSVELRQSDRLQVERVRFSQAELQEQYDRLVSLRLPAFQAVYMHTKLNRVGVIVDLPLERNESQKPLSKDSLPDNLSQLVTHPAIVVYDGRIEVEQVILRGGDRWSKAANGRDCTLGFKVRDNATRRYGMVTAGHCVTELGLQIGSKAYSGSRFIGMVGSYIDGAGSPYGVGIDAAFIRTRSPGMSTDDVNYVTSYFDIVGETFDYTLGRIRCFTGQMSGTKCSPITCQNQQYSYNGKYYTRLFTMDADNTNGDSGSPVYEVVGQTDTVRITGVLVTRMRSVPGTTSCLNGWDGGVSRWDDVKNYLNLSLVTTR